MDHANGQGELTSAAGFRLDDELAGLKPRPEDEVPTLLQLQQGEEASISKFSEAGPTATNCKNTVRQPNAYEAKQEAKRERLERASDNAAAESARRFAAARGAVAGIEPGQPILCGHHSEKRHRAALKRHDQNMRAGVDASDRAAELSRRAEAVGTGGISSDDPAAVAKLDDKRTALERERDAMKAANAYHKAHGSLDGWDGPADIIKKGNTNLRVWTGVYARPFPPYCLSNIGAEIRRAAKRAGSLAQRQEVSATSDPTTETINGATITADYQDNRVQVRFPARLSKPDYKRVRSFGFVWSPSRDAFVRKLTGPGVIEYARRLVLLILPNPPTV
jgi:hypothetical protein